jgi:hypothetical protein
VASSPFPFLLAHILQVVSDLAITPPLSPYAQDEEYFIPDAQVCEVPAASDPGSMLSDDLKAAESVIVQKELQRDILLIPDVDTPKLSPLLNTSTLNKQPNARSTRIESPLSPFTPPLRSSNEGPDIPGLLRSMNIDDTSSHPDTSEIDAGQTFDTDGTFDNNLQTVIEENAATMMRSIDQERISIEDAMARIEVPILDFSIPEPEWHALPMNVMAHLQWLFESYSVEIPRCAQNSRADPQLRWVPFLQKVDTQTLIKEIIHCDRDLPRLLDFPDAKEVLTSANYVWKQPGLAILREPESEDDLEKVASPVKSVDDLASLARKRRLEDIFVDEDQPLSSGSESFVDLIVPSQDRKPYQQVPKRDRTRQGDLLPGRADSNSAVSILLSNFIDIRTAKRQKQDRSSFFPTKPEAETIPVLSSKTLRPIEKTPSLPKTIERPGKKVESLTPCPKLGTLNAPTKLIKGLTLSRGLFSHLEELYPTAEIIERDFDRWNTITWDHHSVLRSPVVSSLAAEADIIISPATGIIVTTLLKVIQKPLPSQEGQSAIRERVSGVALRYERLIVLVSEGNMVDETVRDLTPSEMTLYAEFVGFAAALETRVEVFYVGGGEVTLATWLVSFAARYGLEAAETQEHLIQDETQWELFLRRAGFNAYAAQSILACLKTPGSISVEEDKCFDCGLAAFVKMTPGERVQRFQNLMGGKSVLNRVNRILEMRWR